MKNSVIIFSLFILAACGSKKSNTNESIGDGSNEKIQSDSIRFDGFEEGYIEQQRAIYQATETVYTDLIHTKLEVNFDWAKSRMNGVATITAKPHFYASDSLILDAKGMDILSVQLDGNKLMYSYDSSYLRIKLNKVYTGKDKYTVTIAYVAKPDERTTGGSAAITSDKGLYFINPKGEDKSKMPQIWTQGETEASSVWFPTIDAPNVKTTQEIYITVQDKYTTLSNGKLISSKKNADGTRTDYWKQELPHAPYLFMMGVCEFKVVKDTYTRPDGTKMDVNYFVEPEYEQYAKAIFGETPNMIAHFSKLLGYEYAWDKYNQIVVRDYVSGAMENTGAVVFGDYVYKTDRELLDANDQSTIAHELFHHWFGDLVTCESWSNVPLNESFATYGEYIWQEEAYGRMEADCEFNNNLRAYLGQKQKHKVEPIRYHYQSRDDMFDVVSYQKGGAMLHMLRKIIGDDAFFASLKLYLTQNAYKTAELANLRMAFEEVTGQDLNWFFNQWFLKPGHPDVSFGYIYNAARTEVTITIQQYQQTDWGWYRLPLTADIYTANGIKRVHFTATEEKQSFTFTTDAAIDFVNVDAERALVATITDLKPNSELLLQAMRAPLYMDKYYAVKELTKALNDSLTAPFMPLADYLLTHEFWGIRKLGVEFLGSFDKNYAAYEQRISEMALHDSSVA